MTVHYHVLLTLGFSEPELAHVQLDWTGLPPACGWLHLREYVCPWEKPFPYLQKQSDGCPTAPWRWEGTWGNFSLHSAAPLCTEFHWYSQKDEMALLPKLHLKRVVAHSSGKTHSEKSSIPLFLNNITNKHCICLGFTSVRPASSVGRTCSVLLPSTALCRNPASTHVKGIDLLFIKARPNVSFSE